MQLIVGTPNARLQMAAGAYTVLAERSETRAVLLEGRAVMFSRSGDERQEMVIPGDDLTMKAVRTKDGGIEIKTAVSCIDEKRSIGLDPYEKDLPQYARAGIRGRREPLVWL